MRPLQLIRRWKRLIKRAHRRHGNHPLKAIYYEAIRRRYMRLGRWLERRQSPTMTVWPQIEPPAVEPPYVPMPTKLEDWPVPDWVTALLPQPPQTQQWPNVEWSRHSYDTHPDLYTSKTPLGSRKTVRLEPLPDDSWLTSDKHTGPFDISVIDTRKVLPEETEKYIALPKFLREE